MDADIAETLAGSDAAQSHSSAERAFQVMIEV
jgi:hypothetical protein